VYRFGVFEFDPGSRELRKSGRPVALEPQPTRALAVLLARADQLVTRDELKDAVWGKDTHVDFDRGLAYCISQIRTALGDAGDSPRFIQTVPKKGYRFIAPVHLPAPVLEMPNGVSSQQSEAVQPEPSARFRRPLYLALAAAALLSVGIATGLALRSPAGADGRVVVAVSLFDNETGLIEYDRLISGLSDVVVARLTLLAPERIGVVGNAAILRQPRNIRNLNAVAESVQADYVLLGQLQQADSGLRFITHFIRLSDGTHLRANRLSFPDRDVTSLERQVVAEFERAVQLHVLSSAADR
jgi:DNA-binding winged helix-turn-helix (wHTH) protein/TolB-like protein